MFTHSTPPQRIAIAERGYLSHAFGEKHPVDPSTIPVLSHLPLSLIMAMYEDILFYGPNGANVGHMKDQLRHLIQNATQEELDEISIKALQLIEQSIPTADIFTVSARIHYCIGVAVKDSLSELIYALPSYLLSFVALLGFNGYADFSWTLSSAHTKLFNELCELIGENPNTYGFQTMSRFEP